MRSCVSRLAPLLGVRLALRLPLSKAVYSPRIFRYPITRMSTKVINRLDYTPPNHHISRVSLDFDISEGQTVVTSTLEVSPRGTSAGPLVLHKGKHLTLDTTTVDGVAVVPTTEDGLIYIPVPAGSSTVVTRSIIFPEKNTELEGLYRDKSSNYMTQCEAEGFREITPFIDR